MTQTTNNQPGVLRSFVITALCKLLARSPLWRDAGDRLLSAMDQISLDELAMDARSKVAQSTDGFAIADLVESLDRELRARLGSPAPVEIRGKVLEICDEPKKDRKEVIAGTPV